MIAQEGEVVDELQLLYHEAWLWLHCPVPRFRDEMSDGPAVQLSLSPGLTIIPEEINYPRLPLIGMRCLRRNRLQVILKSVEGKVSIDQLE